MQKTAEEDPNFLGAAFFQFQTAHFKGGPELNFGLFKLGDEKLFQIQAPCDILGNCHKPWPVYCLSPTLDWLPGSMGLRAEAVAAAWGGEVPTGQGMCHEGLEVAVETTEEPEDNETSVATTVAVTTVAETSPPPPPAASAASQCSWGAVPRTPWAWDPKCKDGVLGCKADGEHVQCRFCGKPPYAACPKCEFAAEPATQYVWDNRCDPLTYTKGCNADGVHYECRFCGEDDYDPCPTTTATSTSTLSSTMTATTSSATTVAKDVVPSSSSALRGGEGTSGHSSDSGSFPLAAPAAQVFAVLCCMLSAGLSRDLP